MDFSDAKLPEIKWKPVLCVGCGDTGVIFSAEQHGVPEDVPCPCTKEGTIAKALVEHSGRSGIDWSTAP